MPKTPEQWLEETTPLRKQTSEARMANSELKPNILVVDDEDVVQVALMRLFTRVRQKPAGVEFFKRDAAAAVGEQVHGIFLTVLGAISRQN